MGKISDLVNVVKYRKRYNSMELKYFSTLEKYTTLLEKDRSMLDDNKILKDELTKEKNTNRQYKRLYGRLPVDEKGE